MDSAVLLGGESVAEGPTAAKALHHLEASCQLLDTAAPTPTASGALDDWQVHAGPWLMSPVSPLTAGSQPVDVSQEAFKHSACSAESHCMRWSSRQYAAGSFRRCCCAVL